MFIERSALDKVYEILSKIGEADIKSENRSYYHYTNMKGVLGIFKDFIDCRNKEYDDSYKFVNRCSVYASNIRYLNDAQEYKEGLQYCKDIIGDLASPDMDIYSTSFCGNGDLLSQWSMYGGKSGIAIGFNFQNIEVGLFKQKERDNENTFYKSLVPIKVNYEIEERKEFFNQISKEIMESMSSDYRNKLLQSILIPFCKNKFFKNEQESRLVFYYCPVIGRIYDSLYSVNDEKGLIKPALNIQYKSIEADSNIINELIVGPGYNQNLVFNALIHIFDMKSSSFYEGDKKEYQCTNGIKIKKSAIPYRG